MRRIAILLGCPTTSRLNDLPGARSDILIHHQHLLSDEGGAWTDEEVWRVEAPTVTTLPTVIEFARNYDYAYVAFSGHGSQPVGRPANEGLIFLADGNQVRVRDIFPPSKRAVVVVDACRELVNEPEEKTAKRAFLEGFSQRSSNYRALCRSMFDSLVMRRGEGEAVLVTSCSAGQTAGETSHGGSFTRAFAGAVTRHQQQSPAALFLGQAVTLAARHLSIALRSPQRPEYFPGRSQHDFPFAVWP